MPQHQWPCYLIYAQQVFTFMFVTGEYAVPVPTQTSFLWGSDSASLYNHQFLVPKQYHVACSTDSTNPTVPEMHSLFKDWHMIG